MPIDYKEYHPKWSLIRYLVRFVRAQNRCEWCGARNYEPHPVTGSKVVLTVAHIDHDKNNNRFSNLAALCQSCHLNHDRNQHIANRRYGRKYRGNHQLRLSLNVVTTATGLNLMSPLLLRRGGSSRSFSPRIVFFGFGIGEKQVFEVKTVFCKPPVFMLQLLQTTVFFKENQYSKELQRVTTRSENPIVVTFCYKAVTFCYKLLQTSL